MASILKVDTIQDQAGNNIISENANVITIGASGDTITVPAGATVSGFTSAGIDDNATSTAITIDSSERVGIGTSSPTVSLHVNSGTLNATSIFESTDANSIVWLKDSGGATALDQVSGSLKFNTGYDTSFSGGSEAMRIDSSGNVGINTSSPSTKLEVQDGARGIVIKSTGDTGYTQGSMLIEGHESSSNPQNRGQGIYLFNHGNDINWYMGTSYQGAGDFAICSLSDTAQQNSTADDDNSRLVIDTSGNVGINTKTPTERLHVFDDASSGTTSVDIANFQQSSNDSGGGALSLATAIKIGGTTRYAQIKALHNQYASSATALSFWLDNGTNTEKMRLTSGGSLGVGTTSPDGSDFGSQTGLVHIKDVGGNNTGIKLEQGAGKSFWYQNATNTFFGSGSSHPLRIYTNNTERMRINSSGNVGIGTSSPSAKLNVNGAIVGAQKGDSSPDNTDVSGVNSLTVSTGAGSQTINGLVGGVAGQVLHIIKTNSAFTLTIADQNATSPGDDIKTADGSNISLTNFGGVTLLYYNGAWWEVGK